MKKKPATEKIPYIRNTPTGPIELERSGGVTKSWKSTVTSSVIIVAPRATSVHTSAA